jgi:hypothetical protein
VSPLFESIYFEWYNLVLGHGRRGEVGAGAGSGVRKVLGVWAVVSG